MSPKVFDQSGWLSGGTRSVGGLPTDPNNQPPVADFTYVPTALSVTFTSTSTDSDGTIVATAWNFGDGNSGSGTPVTHVYGAAGPYTVTITVTDDDSASGTASRAIAVVASGGTPPICDFTVAKSALVATFTDISTDDGSVVSWAWTFGDGGTSTSQNPAHTYTLGGTYTVTLTVHDNAGNTGTRTRAVSVTSGSVATTRTRISAQGMATANYGISVTPDSEDQDVTAAGWLATTTGKIDKARAAGSGGRAKTPACILIFKCTPGNASLKDANGNFVLSKWQGYFDKWVSDATAMTGLAKPGGGTYATGMDKLRDAFHTGHLCIHYCLDDFTGAASQTDPKANGFASAVSWFDVESLGYHVKHTHGLTWMPCTGRSPASHWKSILDIAIAKGISGPDGTPAGLKPPAFVRYKWMDCAWNQMRLDRDGDVGTYITNEIAAAQYCNIGMMGGGNLLNGGRWVWTDATKTVKQHADVAWRQLLPGETAAQYDFRMHPNLADFFGMSPSEITELGGAMLAKLSSTGTPVFAGFDLWRGDGGDGGALAYWSRTDIQNAMLSNYNFSVGRNEGPYSVRADLTPA